MKIAILGWADQGKSAYEYWKGQENELTICDSREGLDIPADCEAQLGENYLRRLDRFDMIVRAAPSIHPRDIITANSFDIVKKVTSNTNEFMAVCPSRNIIGVTGTKGKGTTSTLIAKMLTAAGKTVHLGGNIGIPPLDLLKNDIQKDDWVVLELANFQLIDIKTSPMIAVCLMVAPEHLNWHADMAEYVTAKQQMFVWQTFDDVAIYMNGNEYSTTIAGAGHGTKIPYFAPPGAVIDDGAVSIMGQVICHTSELKLLGEHNWQNVCAAVTAAWQITHSASALRSVLTEFTGLPFRIEPRQVKNGIRFYNDSFATVPDATIAAMQAVPGKKIMICGGYDRGIELKEFCQQIRAQGDDVRQVLIIGASGDRLATELDNVGFSNYTRSNSKNMEEIVRQASEIANDGDAVVLSPAFASFDMFKNFEERGRKFNEAVNKL